jgi:hypothetical protein
MSALATSSANSSTTVPSILSIPVSEKLTKANYHLWSTQVLPAIRAAQLEDLLTGDDLPPDKDITTIIDNKQVKQRNPVYSAWVARDQAVLCYLLSMLTRETLQHVSRCTTSAQAWRALADLYSSQTRARSVNTRITLATTKKNQLTVSHYYAKLTQYADELAASSAPLRDDELAAYLLAGLDEAYNAVFTVVVARVDPVSPSNLYAQLLSFEQHASLQAHGSFGGSSSAMTATRDCGSYGRGSGGNDCGRGWDRSRGRMTHGGSSYTNTRALHNSNSPDHGVRCALRLATPPTIVGRRICSRSSECCCYF